MPFPPRDEAGPLPRSRRAAARHVAGLAARLNMTVFFTTSTDISLEGAIMTQIYQVSGGSAAERKAHADRIAGRLGAPTEWRNGYYMAKLVTLALPVEFHFNPPIYASDINGGEPGEAA
jgi:hypothetical protein